MKGLGFLPFTKWSLHTRACGDSTPFDWSERLASHLARRLFEISLVLSPLWTISLGILKNRLSLFLFERLEQWYTEQQSGISVINYFSLLTINFQITRHFVALARQLETCNPECTGSDVYCKQSIDQTFIIVIIKFHRTSF